MRSALPSQTGGGTGAGDEVPRRLPAGDIALSLQPAPQLPGSPVCLPSTQWGQACVATSLVVYGIFLSLECLPYPFPLKCCSRSFPQRNCPHLERYILSYCLVPLSLGALTTGGTLYSCDSLPHLKVSPGREKAAMRTSLAGSITSQTSTLCKHVPDSAPPQWQTPVFLPFSFASLYFILHACSSVHS